MPQKVPISLIQQVCYPTSYRLPKLALLVVERTKVEPARRPFPEYRTRRLITEEGGNLASNNYYRFLLGAYTSTSLTATCRWCGKVLGGASLHKVHGKSTCRPHLVQAYRVLLALERCAVCNHFCGKNQKWGVPLCKDECQDEWKWRMSIEVRKYLQRMFEVETAKEEAFKQHEALRRAAALSVVASVSNSKGGF